MASNFNLGSLSAYTKTNEDMLIIKSFYEGKTASLMTPIPDVKSTIQVPALADALIWQDGATCAFNASGDTTISARVLTVGRIKVNKEWCIQDLETKYTQLLLKPGSNYDALPGGIDEAFVNTVIGTTEQDVEVAIWQGDTTHWNSQLNKFDGLIKIIGAASGPIQANAAAYMTPVTSITAANILAIMQGIYAAIPAALLNKPDLKVFIGEDMSRLYITALVNANLFHYASPENSLGEYKIHGTNVTVVPVNGLTGTSKAYALRTSNMFLGFDVKDEYENMEFWYSQDFDMVRFKNRFKLGVQVSQVAEIVKFTLS